MAQPPRPEGTASRATLRASKRLTNTNGVVPASNAATLFALKGVGTKQTPPMGGAEANRT